MLQKGLKPCHPCRAVSSYSTRQLATGAARVQQIDEAQIAYNDIIWASHKVAPRQASRSVIKPINTLSQESPSRNDVRSRAGTVIYHGIRIRGAIGLVCCGVSSLFLDAQARLQKLASHPSRSLPQSSSLQSSSNTSSNWKSNEPYIFYITHNSQIVLTMATLHCKHPAGALHETQPMSTSFLLLQVQSSAKPAPTSNSFQIYHLSSLRLSPSALSSAKPPPSPSLPLSSVIHTRDTRQLTARKSSPSPGRLPLRLPAGALPLSALAFRLMVLLHSLMLPVR
jgi:hypothetical protein